MRQSNKHWSCIICGKDTYDLIVCQNCSQAEKDRQRSQPGSLTLKQHEYILYLLAKIGNQRFFVANSDSFMLTVIPDYDDLQDITSNQAGEMISMLLSVTNKDEDGLTWRAVDMSALSEDSNVVRKYLLDKGNADIS